ncbi:anthrone oxygenase family protein [Alicyclobacillus fodiniaquatilis]|uniref:Anthrone oxygenase family protein n=1 Tax=Alicyclobacillus fodiniaquatilis TaxID=1661150 RepID=A0ABW4JD07_9BACL
MFQFILAFINLFFVGLLAGEEFVIRLGVRDTLLVLDDPSHIKLRQALIRTLRVLVPVIMLPAIISGVTLAIVDATSRGCVFSWAGAVALLVFLAVTMFGTVPINAGALEWNPNVPPQNWKSLINRWESLNNVRCLLAVVSFVLFLVSAALHFS